MAWAVMEALMVVVMVVVWAARAVAWCRGRGTRVSTDKYMEEIPVIASKRRGRCSCCAGVTALAAAVVIIIVYFAWTPDNYLVWNRVTRQVEIEIIPPDLDKPDFMIYAFTGAATWPLAEDVFNQIGTHLCGAMYSKNLITDAQKKAAIYDTFIAPYNIPMEDYQRPNYQDYTTVNDWFTRKIRPELRPVAPGNVAVSPADARIVGFQSLANEDTYWLKGAYVSVAALLGDDTNGAYFEGGSMVIVRLSPQDYHRFHAPVAGTVSSIYSLGGTLHSVNSNAIRSGNNALLNHRRITLLQTDAFGVVGVVSVGALCVGSVNLEVSVGDTVAQGDPMGYYQFGGSTNVVLFQRGAAILDEDILAATSQNVETLIHMGNRIAIPAGPIAP